MNGPVRIAVIGAGPAGLSQLHAFQTKVGGLSDSEIICYEKENNIGGQWNASALDFGTSGEPKSSCMYRNLWSNGPKECLEYEDYTFLEHFKKPTESYLPREALYDYILARAKKSDILKHIRFGMCIRWLSFDAIQSQFTLHIEDLKTGGTKLEVFDYVVVATGHFSTPNSPSCEGIETFSGQVIHSRQVHDARHFAGKHLVIVGSGFSAEDIGMQAIKYGASSVTYSYRRKPMGYKWPENVEEKPAIAKVANNCVCFIDGSSVKADVIIFATGYLHSFPFLEESLKLKATRNTCYPPDLYKGVAWINNTQLFYLGMQNQHYSYTMFDAQAFWVMGVILGEISLPEKEAMIADTHMLWFEAENLGSTDEESEFQTRYIKDLRAETNHSKTSNFDLDLALFNFHKWNKDRRTDILTYRDGTFTSPVDGTLSIEPKIPWVERKLDFDSKKYSLFPILE